MKSNKYKIISNILIVFILFFAGFFTTNATAINYNDIDKFLWKYYNNIAKKIPNIEKRISKLKLINKKINKLYIKNNNKSRKITTLLLYIRSNIKIHITFLENKLYTSKYFIKNWRLYFNSKEMYLWEFYGKNSIWSSDFLKECSERTQRNWRYKFPSGIIAENKNYLIYNISLWICEGGWSELTYVLNKKTNISKNIRLKNEVNTFNKIDDTQITLNEFNWRILRSAGNIQKKWYYNNSCAKCWITYKWIKTIYFSNIEKYLNDNNVFKMPY
jgi:hypothetical protein